MQVRVVVKRTGSGLRMPSVQIQNGCHPNLRVTPLRLKPTNKILQKEASNDKEGVPSPY